MRALVLVGLVLALVVLPIAAVVLTRRTPLATSTPVDRNHVAMARWIERQLGDDMVRCTIPDPQQDIGRSLLAEFYGDDTHDHRKDP